MSALPPPAVSWRVPRTDPVVACGLGGDADARRASSPHVLRFGGDYHMYYWATGFDGFHRICLAFARVDAPHEWHFAGTVLSRQAGTAYNAMGPGFPFVVPRDDSPWLMYFGAWGVPRDDGKLANTTGLALSDDHGRTWRHAGQSPVLALDRPWDHEGTGSVCVLVHDGVLRMYYTALGDYSPRPAGVRTGHGDVIPHIGVGYAESDDGIRWRKPLDGLMISPRGFDTEPFEYIVSKPFVLRHDAGWTMWVNTFGTAYRVRSLVSRDGLNWTWTASGPDGDLGVGAAGSFDDHQRSYVAVVPHGGGLRCWYTGNGFGQTGIGYATTVQSGGGGVRSA